MSERRGFLLYPDMYEMLELLTVEERGEVTTALFMYKLGLPVPEMEKHIDMAYRYIKGIMDRDDARYAERCAKNRANGALGGRARAKAQEMPPPAASFVHELLTEGEELPESGELPG